MNFKFLKKTIAGGSSTTLTGDPMKSVKVRADIWPDQPDVPAESPTRGMVSTVEFLVLFM